MKLFVHRLMIDLLGSQIDDLFSFLIRFLPFSFFHTHNNKRNEEEGGRDLLSVSGGVLEDGGHNGAHILGANEGDRWKVSSKRRPPRGRVLTEAIHKSDQTKQEKKKKRRRREEDKRSKDKVFHEKGWTDDGVSRVAEFGSQKGFDGCLCGDRVGRERERH